MSKNLKKSISRPKWASRYRSWTKTDVQEKKGEFVQILHNGKYHWVPISNINVEN